MREVGRIGARRRCRVGMKREDKGRRSRSWEGVCKDCGGRRGGGRKIVRKMRQRGEGGLRRMGLGD